jgi:hypothetical protein
MLYRNFSGLIEPVDEPAPLNPWALRALDWFASAIQPGTAVSIASFRNACIDMGAELSAEGRAMLRGLANPYATLA